MNKVLVGLVLASMLFIAYAQEAREELAARHKPHPKPHPKSHPKPHPKPAAHCAAGQVQGHKDATCKVRSTAGAGKLHCVCAPGFERVKGKCVACPKPKPSTKKPAVKPTTRKAGATTKAATTKPTTTTTAAVGGR